MGGQSFTIGIFLDASIVGHLAIESIEGYN